MKNLKKITTLFVASILMLSLFSVNVFADDALEDYLEGNDSGYSAILLVQQPIEDTRYCLDPDTFDVGHTFLRLSDGSNVTYVGFYPKKSVGQKQLILGTSVAGKTKDDYDHIWNWGKRYKLTKSQYNKVKNYTTSNSSKNYNALSYNCSTFAIKALKAGNISDFEEHKWTVPSPIDESILAKIRNWTGYCPGNLGMDISTSSPRMYKDKNGNVREKGGGGGSF